MPLVSVVVPTFNRAYCVARAIDSALAQSHADLEIIVVDDGSTDDTARLIREQYAGECRVRYLRQENQGVSSARNAGLKAARGEFVALLDSDDIWLPWKLEIQIRCFEYSPHVGMVWSDMEAIDQTGAVTSLRYLRTMYSCWNHYPDPRHIFSEAHPLKQIVPEAAHVVGEALFYAGGIFSPMIRGNLVHTSTVVLRRDRLERVGGFNEQYKPAGEDYDFHLRTCHAGPVGLLDVATIQYQIGLPDQITNSRYGLAFAQNYLRAIEPMIEHHRSEIRLSRAVLNSVLAEANEWLGEEYFWRHQSLMARRHLARSLRYRVRPGRALKLLLASLLPFRWWSSRRAAGSRS